MKSSNSIKLQVREKMKRAAKACVKAVMPKPPLGRNKKWTMKGGKTIRIRDMENGHLLNTIRLLERMADSEQGICMAMAEAEYDGYSYVFDDSDVSDFYPIYDDMVAEALHRGLDLSLPAFAANRVATPDEFPG